MDVDVAVDVVVAVAVDADKDVNWIGIVDEDVNVYIGRRR